jgi:hypothetical protein
MIAFFEEELKERDWIIKRRIENLPFMEKKKIGIFGTGGHGSSLEPGRKSMFASKCRNCFY